MCHDCVSLLDRPTVGTESIETRTGAGDPGGRPAPVFVGPDTQSRVRLTGNVGIGSNRGPLASFLASFGSFLSGSGGLGAGAGASAVLSGSVEARYIQVAFPVQRMPDGSAGSPAPS